MSTLKTKIDPEIVLEFLRNNFDTNIPSVGFLKGGEMSQAFYFNSEKNNYVIRIDKKKNSFEKDRYAYEHFASKLIPIPKILTIGKVNEKYYFAISEEASGKNLDEFSEDVNSQLLPELIAILNGIHKVEIDKGRYGDWDSDGKATFDSWREFILNKRDDVYSNWDKLYKETFIEKEPIDQVYKKIKELASYLPEERCLVHGDYGFNNVVSDGKKITGILDWGESKYGDFLYDIAWLEFWGSNIRYGKIFEDHYFNKGDPIFHYRERLLCYQLHLGLGALGFFALSNQKDSYSWTKQKLLSLL